MSEETPCRECIWCCLRVKKELEALLSKLYICEYCSDQVISILKTKSARAARTPMPPVSASHLETIADGFRPSGTDYKSMAREILSLRKNLS